MEGVYPKLVANDVFNIALILALIREDTWDVHSTPLVPLVLPLVDPKRSYDVSLYYGLLLTFKMGKGYNLRGEEAVGPELIR